jgi:hypothetical protein
MGICIYTLQSALYYTHLSYRIINDLVYILAYILIIFYSIPSSARGLFQCILKFHRFILCPHFMKYFHDMSVPVAESLGELASGMSATAV